MVTRMFISCVSILPAFKRVHIAYHGMSLPPCRRITSATSCASARKATKSGLWPDHVSALTSPPAARRASAPIARLFNAMRCNGL